MHEQNSFFRSKVHIHQLIDRHILTHYLGVKGASCVDCVWAQDLGQYIERGKPNLASRPALGTSYPQTFCSVARAQTSCAHPLQGHGCHREANAPRALNRFRAYKHTPPVRYAHTVQQQVQLCSTCSRWDEQPGVCLDFCVHNRGLGIPCPSQSAKSTCFPGPK